MLWSSRGRTNDCRLGLAVADSVEGLALMPGLEGVGRFGVDREPPNMLHGLGKYPVPAK